MEGVNPTATDWAALAAIAAIVAIPLMVRGPATLAKDLVPYAKWLRYALARLGAAVLRRRLHYGYRTPGRMDAGAWTRLSEALAARYELDPLRIGDQTFPIAMMWQPLEDGPDVSLPDLGVCLDAVVPERRPGLDRWIVRGLLERPGSLAEKEHLNYCLEELDLGGSLPRLAIRMGWYYDNFIETQGLEREVFRFLRKATAADAIRRFGTRGSLPLRDSADARAPSILSGAGRVSAIGVSTLFIVRRQHTAGWSIALGKRSLKTSAWSGAYHVAPSFLWESVFGAVKEEADVRYGVYRELLEELYDLRQHSEPRNRTPESLLGDPRVSRIRALKDQGLARFAVTGLAVDLLTRKLEILCALRVDDPRFLLDFPPKFSDEYEQLEFVPIQEAHVLLSTHAASMRVVPVGLASAMAGLAWFGHDRAG